MSDVVRISILGATGSVGKATRDVVAGQGTDGPVFQVAALTAHSNADQLAAAAIEQNAEFAAIARPELYADLKSALAGTGITAAAGDSGIAEAAAHGADMVVVAIVGIAGLQPTLAALETGASVALANKESMVCGGTLLTNVAKKSGARLLPIDSEHNAIFQVLDRRERVEKVTLTASGGPFRCSSLDEMEKATRATALRHPNWSMGAKISIDSATMMNKGLELIEAAYLFDLEPDQIDIVVHPQSIVHSLVNYDDGSVLAQMGQPDMRIPISYALSWPRRMKLPAVERLDLAKIGRLDFEPPDFVRFPALNLARHAIERKGAAPIILNAANEIAVEAFLQDQIGFLSISAAVEEMLEQDTGYQGEQPPVRLEDILGIDEEIRRRTKEKLRLPVALPH